MHPRSRAELSSTGRVIARDVPIFTANPHSGRLIARRNADRSVWLDRRIWALAEEKKADWDYFRSQIGACERLAYFDNAAVAPISLPAQAAIAQWAQQSAFDGVTAWSGWAAAVERVRGQVADLINARRSEVAFVPNTTGGISLIAEGLPWREGDNVVIPASEFPANQYPWMNLESRGVLTRRVPMEGPSLDVDRLLGACDSRTRVLSVSWVAYASGWRVDLSALVAGAHERGILVMLDAIQGLGVFPLDVRRLPLDFLAADGHKWMLGPEGAGILYVRSELLDELRPLNVGWNSVVHHHDYARIEMNLRPGAVRYEGGSQNMVGVIGLGASLKLLRQVGLGPERSAIGDRVIWLAGQLRRELEQVGARVFGSDRKEHQSGIVAFDFPDKDLDPARIRRQLMQVGVVVNVRGGRLRASPHAYCNEQDISRLLDALQMAIRP